MQALLLDVVEKLIFCSNKTLFKVADFNSKELRSHFKNNETCLETCLKNPEKSLENPRMLSV